MNAGSHFLFVAWLTILPLAIAFLFPFVLHLFFGGALADEYDV